MTHPRLNNLIAYWHDKGYSIQTAGGEELLVVAKGGHRFSIRAEARKAGRQLALARGVRFVGAQYYRKNA